MQWLRYGPRPIAAVVAVVIFAAMTPACAGAPPDDLADFLATYECTVGDLLARIHRDRRQDDRYLILDDAVTHRYVQCLYFDHDRQMLCEAASGWWDAKGSAPGFKPNMAPERLQALTHLGFSLDASHGNFQRRLRFAYGPDYEEVARVMLSALYSGYGARVANGVFGEAPYAIRGQRLLAKNRCVPVS